MRLYAFLALAIGCVVGYAVYDKAYAETPWKDREVQIESEVRRSIGKPASPEEWKKVESVLPSSKERVLIGLKYGVPIGALVGIGAFPALILLTLIWYFLLNRLAEVSLSVKGIKIPENRE